MDKESLIQHTRAKIHRHLFIKGNDPVYDPNITPTIDYQFTWNEMFYLKNGKLAPLPMFVKAHPGVNRWKGFVFFLSRCSMFTSPLRGEHWTAMVCMTLSRTEESTPLLYKRHTAARVQFGEDRTDMPRRLLGKWRTDENGLNKACDRHTISTAACETWGR